MGWTFRRSNLRPTFQVWPPPRQVAIVWKFVLFIIISGSAAQRGLWPPVALQPSAGYGLLFHEISCSHTTTRHSRQDSSGRVISSSQRPLPDNIQHIQLKNIHASGGIRTHDLSRRATVDRADTGAGSDSVDTRPFCEVQTTVA
jgi:hypothetical protein